MRDATAVSEMLKAKGVHVFDAYNCTKKELAKIIKAFLASLQPGDAALIYFAGHGCEYNNANRLMLISESEASMIREDSWNVLALINRFAHCQVFPLIATYLKFMHTDLP